MIHPKLHDLIYVLCISHPFKKGVNRLIDHGHQDPITDKPREIIGRNRRLTQLCGQVLSNLEGLVSGGEPLYNLHKFHHGYRIHKMHADNLSRPSGGTSYFGNGYGRGIGREYDLFLTKFIQITENLKFQFLIFCGGFHHKIRLCHIID